jgi:hypothetical protein
VSGQLGKSLQKVASASVGCQTDKSLLDVDHPLAQLQQENEILRNKCLSLQRELSTINQEQCLMKEHVASITQKRESALLASYSRFGNTK